jgi:acyl carrier protein phosphodiesterase
MNYLAHAYLSFNNTEILVGNMISDFVKGAAKLTYSKNVQDGITLHRQIDGYTDAHPVVKHCKSIFRPTYRLYSGAFVDVTMDHFLAKKLSQEIDLMAFTQNVYTQLELHENEFPEPFKKMFPYMKMHNWLYHYQYNWGIEKSYTGLKKRALYIAESDSAFALFEKHYSFFEEQFLLFWNDLYEFSHLLYRSL